MKKKNRRHTARALAVCSLLAAMALTGCAQGGDAVPASVPGGETEASAGEPWEEAAGTSGDIPAAEAGTAGTDTGAALPLVLYTEDGRHYTAVTSRAVWDGLTEPERALYWDTYIPVLEDEYGMLDTMGENVNGMPGYEEGESLSCNLARELYYWCRNHGVAATRGEYLCYKEYVSSREESCYVALNDPEGTIVTVTAYLHGIEWIIEEADGTREQILAEAARLEEEMADEPEYVPEAEGTEPAEGGGADGQH